MSPGGAGFVETATRVRAHLNQDFRFAHVVRVARFADRLAQRHGVDPGKARVAGLLHDLARLYSADRLVEECTERHMSIDAFERANPIVLHARLGAELARDDFAVDDPQILSAIRKHTVAAPVMEPLDRVIFLADALEPGRDYADRAEIAALAFRDMDAAMYAVLLSTVDHLRSRGQQIAPQTLAALALVSPLPHSLASGGSHPG